MDHISTPYCIALAPQYDLTTPLLGIHSEWPKETIIVAHKRERDLYHQGTHCTDIDGRSLKLNHIGSHYIRDHKINPHYNNVDGLAFFFFWFLPHKYMTNRFSNSIFTTQEKLLF